MTKKVGAFFMGLFFSHHGYEVSLLNDKTFGLSDYNIHWTILNNAHTFFIPATKGIDSSSALADGGVGGRGVTNSDNSAASPDGAKCTPSYGIHGTNIHIDTTQDSRFCLRMYLYHSCLIQCYVNACRVLNLQEFIKIETPLSNST